MKRILTFSILAVTLVALGCEPKADETAESAEQTADPAPSAASDEAADDEPSAEEDEEQAAEEEADEEPVAAVANMQPTEGNTVEGTVRFEQVEDGVKVIADLEGLGENTTHGFHIHEKGDCSAPDGTSAGGHYNPEGHEHAGPDADQRHAGDLGNIESDAEGKVHHEITVSNITIDGDMNPIVGKGVIVHAEADDLESQPTGAAGPRVSCGVIELEE
jgi:Cu-Zn family superoxide dismutase